MKFLIASSSLNSYSFLNDIIQVVPVVGVFAVIVVVLWRNKMEVEKHNRQIDHENLETLQDLSSLLSNLLSTIDRSKDEVLNRIKEEAGHTREHVNNRITLLESRVNNEDGKK